MQFYLRRCFSKIISLQISRHLTIFFERRSYFSSHGPRWLFFSESTRDYSGSRSGGWKLQKILAFMTFLAEIFRKIAIPVNFWVNLGWKQVLYSPSDHLYHCRGKSFCFFCEPGVFVFLNTGNSVRNFLVFSTDSFILNFFRSLSKSFIFSIFA